MTVALSLASVVLISPHFLHCLNPKKSHVDLDFLPPECECDWEQNNPLRLHPQHL